MHLSHAAGAVRSFISYCFHMPYCILPLPLVAPMQSKSLAGGWRSKIMTPLVDTVPLRYSTPASSGANAK